LQQATQIRLLGAAVFGCRYELRPLPVQRLLYFLK